MKTLLIFVFLIISLIGLPSRAQDSAKPPANPQSGRIHNIAPEETWKRVTQCVFPTSPQLAGAHIAGTVDIGLGISPAGEVGNYRILHSDDPLLIEPAIDAIRQWKFQLNVVQGEVSWSRVRALVRFNADGTTAIDLGHAILPDNFGDPGIPASAGTRSAFLAAVAVPRPESAQACKSTEGQRSGAPASVQLGRLARQAYDISDDQASRLEESLSHDPHDLAARAQLLGYYFAAGRHLSPEVLHEARLRHILWLVQNHPESELAGISEATIDPAGGPLADRAGYEKVKALWLEQVKAHNDTVMVLANAAWFFKLPDKASAARLLKRLSSIDPGNQNWSAHLGMVYAGAIVGLTGMNQNRFPTAADPEEARGSFAQQAREELSRSEDAQVVGTACYYLWFWGSILNSLGATPSDYADLAEKCLARAQERYPGNLEWPLVLAKLYELRATKAKSPEERSSMLRKRLESLEKALSRVSYRGALTDFSDLANAACEAGEFEKAEMYARKALELAPQNRTDSYYGAALNRANSILGRVALHAGDVEKAKSYLLAAGQIPREPKFDSFPDMGLAKELLDRGEKQTVLDYLELCKDFWNGSGNALAGWIQTIKSGGTPDLLSLDPMHYAATLSPAAMGNGPRKNPKLSTQLADLAQVIPQRNAPLAPGEKVAPPNGFSVEKLPKSAQDAVRAGMMRINEKGEVQVYIEMTEIWGSNLTQLSSLGVTPQRIVLGVPTAVPTQQVLLPITMINQVAMLPFVRYIRLPD